MADQDELKLKLVLDTEAFDAWFKEYQNRPAEIPIAPSGTKGGGKGTSSESAQLKRDIQTRIDLIDLEARTMQRSANEQIKSLQQRAAAGKITTNEMVAGIQLQEAAQERATQLAINGYAAVEKQIAQTTQLTLAQSVALEKKLFYAQERASTGFVSMSRSMGTLTSGTKNANIAFANFGRIVQDAPFGLLGISNNIDPLLVSFAALREEQKSVGGAFKALGSQLLGPAGLIFLLGSALPTALLFAQKFFKDAEKESNLTADAVKKVREEFAKLSAQAAGEKGLDQINSELKDNQTALNSINSLLEKYQTNQSNILALQNQSLQQGGLSESQQAELNRLRAENTNLGIQQLQTDKAIVETNTSELELAKARITAQEDITSARQRYGIATSLTAKEEEKTADERAKSNKAYNDLLQRTREEREKILAIEKESLYVNQLSLEMGSVADMLASESFDEFEVKTESIANTTFDTYRRLALDRIMFERQFTDSALLIAQERDNKLQELSSKRLSLELQDEDAFQQQRQLIIDEYSAQERELARAVTMEKANQMAVYGDAVSAGLGAIFGENKAVQAAQVVIDTITGANKAFAGLMPNFPLAVAAAASVTAQGISALRKINSSTKNSKSLSGSGSGSASVASISQRPFVTDAISPTATMIASTGAPSVPIFNIQARIDNMGLAIAVRNGESDIATRQIPFAS